MNEGFRELLNAVVEAPSKQVTPHQALYKMLIGFMALEVYRRINPFTVNRTPDDCLAAVQSVLSNEYATVEIEPIQVFEIVEKAAEQINQRMRSE